MLLQSPGSLCATAEPPATSAVEREGPETGYNRCERHGNRVTVCRRAVVKLCYDWEVMPALLQHMGWNTLQMSSKR